MSDLAAYAFTSSSGDWWTGEGSVLEARRRGRGWLYRRSWQSGRLAPTRWLKTSERGLRLILERRAQRFAAPR